MVYDCTRSLVNNALWCPSFGLPTIKGVLRAVKSSTWGTDLDLGEMFLNFTLHDSLQVFCGVDLSEFFPDKIKEGCKTLWEQWTCCLMGLKVSPCQAVRAFLLAEEVMRGRRRDPTNIFCWEQMIQGCPGCQRYAPTTKSRPTSLHTSTTFGPWEDQSLTAGLLQGE